MSSLARKSMQINHYDIDKSLFDGSWKLHKIENDCLILRNAVSMFKKRVTFSENIELHVLDSRVKKIKKMRNYGNPPSRVKQIIEDFILNIVRGKIRVSSKYNLINNLLDSGIYFIFVKECINIYTSLINLGKAMLYTKHTYITNNNKDILLEFINRDINIHTYTNRIISFLRSCKYKIRKEEYHNSIM